MANALHFSDSSWEVTTQIVSKATELFMEMLKIAIEREREKNRLSEKSEVLSGGEVLHAFFASFLACL